MLNSKALNLSDDNIASQDDGMILKDLTRSYRTEDMQSLDASVQKEQQETSQLHLSYISAA